MISFKQFIAEVASIHLSRNILGDDEYEIGSSYTEMSPRKTDKVRRIPMNQITSRFEGDDKSEKTPDNSESRANIDQMATDLKRGNKLPPVLVRRHPKTSGFEVIDGHHRYFAHKEAGRKHIDAMVVPASRFKGDKY